MHTHSAPGAPAAQHGQTGPAASVTENAAQVKEAAAQAGDGPGACAAEAEGAAGAMPEEKRAPGAQAAGGRAQPAQVPGGVQQQRQAAAQAGDGPKACAAEAEGAAGAMPEEKRAPGAQAARGQAQPAQMPGGVQQRQAAAQAGDGPGACAAEAAGAAGAMPAEKCAPGAQAAGGRAQPAQVPGGVQQRQAAVRAKEAGARAGAGPEACAAETEGAAGARPEEKRAPGAQAARGRDAPCPAGAAPMPAEGAQAHGAPGCGRAKLWPLFLATLYISTFTFGGGFVIVTFMKRKFVDSLKWLSEEEMLDFAALAQASPGAIAVNAAILVGWRVCGPAGMAVAVLGTILPPMVILSVVSLFYAAFAANRWVALALKGMQAGVAAVILDVACGLGAGVAKERSALSLALMAGAFLASFVFGVNVIFIILAAALAGVGKTLWHKRKGAGAP